MTERGRDRAASFLLAVVVFIILAACALAGCAHTQCVDPWERAAKHGVVLECVDVYGHREACRVSTPGGDRTFTYRSCE